jgi:plasmid stabilization system protein ParE
VKLEWSDEAIADLDRFAGFLNLKFPSLAVKEIIAKAEIIGRHPKAGRPIGANEDYRQVVLQVLNAAYVFQYRFDGERLVMLRVFHGRETRE